MLGLYYRIWVDCIKRAQLKPANKKNWQQGTLLIMSICMALNIMLIMVLLQQLVFVNFFYYINLDFLPHQIEYLLNFLILFFLPCFGINYLLVFANKRYERLLGKYPYYNGRLILVYLVVSLFLPVILVWIVFFLQ